MKDLYPEFLQALERQDAGYKHPGHPSSAFTGIETPNAGYLHVLCPHLTRSQCEQAFNAAMTGEINFAVPDMNGRVVVFRLQSVGFRSVRLCVVEIVPERSDFKTQGVFELKEDREIATEGPFDLKPIQEVQVGFTAGPDQLYGIKYADGRIEWQKSQPPTDERGRFVMPADAHPFLECGSEGRIALYKFCPHVVRPALIIERLYRVADFHSIHVAAPDLSHKGRLLILGVSDAVNYPDGVRFPSKISVGARCGIDEVAEYLRLWENGNIGGNPFFLDEAVHYAQGLLERK